MKGVIEMSEEEIIYNIEQFLNYESSKSLSGIEVCYISNLLELYKASKKENKSLRDENNFLKEALRAISII